MARPRSWELGVGVVEILTPPESMVRRAKSGAITRDDYVVGYVREVLHRAGSPFDQALRPGALEASPYDGAPRPVFEGDTLCCCCSRDGAARGECHRVWASGLLLAAGWRVILDGRELAGVTHGWRPIWKDHIDATGGS